MNTDAQRARNARKRAKLRDKRKRVSDENVKRDSFGSHYKEISLFCPTYLEEWWDAYHLGMDISDVCDCIHSRKVYLTNLVTGWQAPSNGNLSRYGIPKVACLVVKIQE